MLWPIDYKRFFKLHSDLLALLFKPPGNSPGIGSFGPARSVAAVRQLYTFVYISQEHANPTRQRGSFSRSPSLALRVSVGEAPAGSCRNLSSSAGFNRGGLLALAAQPEFGLLAPL